MNNGQRTIYRNMSGAQTLSRFSEESSLGSREAGQALQTAQIPVYCVQ